VACGVVVAACAALILTFGLGRDQAIYAVVARNLLDGGTPYRDAWDFKPPGIFFVYAFAQGLLGGAAWNARLVEALGLIATSAGLVHLAKRWWKAPTIGWLAAAFGAVVHAQLDFWHTGQPETFGGMLVVAGLVLAARDSAKPQHLIGAGVLLGLAGLLKPPIAGVGAVLAFWHAARRMHPIEAWRPRLRAGLAPIGWVLLGGVLPFVLTVAWFASRGALDDVIRTFAVFTPRYTKLGWVDDSLLGLLGRSAVEWLTHYWSGMAVGLILFVAQFRALWVKPAIGLLIGAIAIQLFGIALQAKFFPYHFASTWPLAALLAAWGWWGLWSVARRRGRLGMLAMVACAAVAIVGRSATKDVYGTFWVRALRRARLFLWDRDELVTIDGLATVADINAGANRAAASFVRERTAPGTPIYVWGFEPAIYHLADRPASSRYIYNVPQRVPWSSEWARPELLAELAERPPAALLVVSNDVMFQVTGDGLSSADIVDDPDGFPELRELVLTRYRQAAKFEDLTVYLRR
jgi:hypothetical protein